MPSFVKWCLACMCALLLVLPLSAQTDYPLELPIELDKVVSDSITSEAIYDWWTIALNTGDTITITMQAYDGLIPLVGVLDSNRTILGRSDTEAPAEQDGTIQYDFRADTAGTYIIVATRDGNANGTSLGTYSLVVSLKSEITPRENSLPEVEFRCGERIFTNALEVVFEENVVVPTSSQEGEQIEFYAVTVYGYDNFMPVIRAESTIRQDPLDCTSSGVGVENSVFTLPNLGTTTVTTDRVVHSSRLLLRNTSPTDRLGTLRFTVGSLDGNLGKFVVVVQGLAINPRDNIDNVSIRLAPRAKANPLSVYMLGNGETRLDPYISVYNKDFQELTTCDDAGGRTCPDVPSVVDMRVMIADGEGYTFVGDRFDAGVVLNPQSTDPMLLQLQSRNGETSGAYTLIFIGELS
jgi:hypothetical protein